jgi:hypothetical protein
MTVPARPVVKGGLMVLARLLVPAEQIEPISSVRERSDILQVQIRARRIQAACTLKLQDRRLGRTEAKFGGKALVRHR